MFTPYQGRIVSLFPKVGDDVQKGQTLFTIDSADLLQAESTLISAAGVLRLTSRALARAKELYAANGIAQKDYDQAISDQQGAEASYRAAFDAVRIFGKTAAEIEKVATTHHIDSILVVPSPVSGRVTARVAAPGLFVQPGNAPAPYTVADISTMWMLANVPESDIARYKEGQAVSVTVPAYRDRVFDGRITTLGTTVDPNTRRVFLRSEIADPDHLLRSGMFANFVINTGETLRSLAVPLERRRPRRRRHDDRLGDHRSQALHQADGEAGRAAGRLSPDTGGSAAGRADRRQRRAVPQQRPERGRRVSGAGHGPARTGPVQAGARPSR